MPRKIANTVVPRNRVAPSPLMKKGGVHEKSATSKRRAAKSIVDAELEDWREALAFERELEVDLPELSIACDGGGD